MFDTTLVDVAIGLIFVYLVLALTCTAVNELLAQLMALRAKKLRAGIRMTLTEGFDDKLYDHPLIAHLAKPGIWNRIFGRLPKKKSAKNIALPSYISNSVFSTALFDILAPTGEKERTVQDIRTGIANMPEGDLKRSLLALLDNVGDDYDKACKAVEKWFDDVMDRVSGQYKRHIQIITLALAVLLAGFLNADSLTLARRLSQDDALRTATVRLAERTVDDMSPPATPNAGADAADDTGVSDTSDQELEKLLQDTQALGLPVGWGKEFRPSGFDLVGWLAKIAGIAATAVAVSLGAPFWFDTLNKFVRVRATGPVPDREEEKEREKGKE
jgi:hypothetical protein